MAPKKELTSAEYIRMTTAPVGGLILSLALPSMATTVITSIYNLADTFFVGQIGTSATAAVGVSFSISMVLMALGFWSGTGGSTLVSLLLGGQKKQQANVITSTAVAVSFGFGLLVCLGGLLGGDSLLRLLGATETILPYARAYSRWILLAGPFTASSMALGQLLRAEGKSKESMFGQISGGVLNMLLDPLFIFVFQWGIGGAAAATAISTTVGWCISISFYLRRRTTVHLSPRHISRSGSDYAQILKMGFPSLCRHGCNMVANVVLNQVSGNWGDAAIAAMSICGRLMYLSNCISGGLNQGSQPVLGFAHGSKNYRRLKEAFGFAVKFSTISMVAFGIAEFIFAPQLIFAFRNDPEVIAIGTGSLRLICLASPFACFLGLASVFFQVTGNPLPSSLLLFIRQLGLYVPMLLILPRMLDLPGLQISAPAADVVMGLVAIPMVLHYFKMLEKAPQTDNS